MPTQSSPVPYEPYNTVTPQVDTPNDYQTVQATPQAFGSGIGEAIQGAGKEAQSLAKHFGDIYAESTARDATTKTAQDMAQAEADLHKLRGNDAVNGYKPFQDRISQIVKQNGSDLSLVASEMYQRDSANLVNNAIFRAGAHVGEQAEQGHLNALTGSIDVNTNLYAQNATNPTGNTYLANIAHAAGEHATALGLDSDSKQAAITKSVGIAGAAAIRSLVQSDPENAKNLFDQFSNSSLSYEDVENGNKVTHQVPYFDAAQRAQVTAEMQGEFKRQSLYTIQDAKDYASTGDDYNRGAVQSAMLRAGHTQADVDAQLHHLDNVKDTFGTAGARTDIQQSLENDKALAFSGKSIGNPPSDDALIKAFPKDPGKRQQIKDQYDDLNTISSFRSGLSTMPEKEAEAYLAAHQPTTSSAGSSAYNLGNVKTAAGALQGTASFVNPSTPVDGAILAANTLRNGYRGLTLQQIGDKWAPSSENNTSDWVSNVSKASGLSPGSIPDMDSPDQLHKLLRGIAVAEKSPSDRLNFSDDVISQGVLASLEGKHPTTTENTKGFAEQQDLYANLVKAKNDYYKNLNEDPAGVLTGNDSILNSMYQAGAKDPVKMNDYINEISKRQEALQIPEANLAVLPKSYATVLTNNLMSNPEQIPDQLNKMATQYGTNWPKVYQSLVQQGGLPSYAQIAQHLGENPDTQKYGTYFMRYMGSEETKGKTDEILMGGEQNLKTLKDAVSNNDDFKQMLTSFQRSGASAKQIADTITSAQKLALSIHFYDTTDGNPAATAIKALTSKYAYLPDGDARVPINRLDSISNNASAMLSDLENKMSPSQFVPDKYADRQQYIDNVKTSPTWITDEANKKILLIDPFNRPVMGKDGKQISIGFDDASIPFNLKLEDKSFIGKLTSGLEGLAN